MKDYKYLNKLTKQQLIQLVSEKVQVNEPNIVVKAIRDHIKTWEQENFVIVALNAAHHILGIKTINIGSSTSAVIDIPACFKYLLLKNAYRFIIAHNHPSGNTNASADDYALTVRFRDAGKLLGIELLDSLIITPISYVNIMFKE